MSFFLPSALGLCEFIPNLFKYVSGGQWDSVLEKVVHIAKTVTQTEDIQDIIQTLRENPNALMEFKSHIQTLETNLELAYLADRQDARKRESTLIVQGKTTYRADVMVFSAAFGLCLCLAALGFYGDDLPGEAVGIISTIAGIFGACLKDAYAFEFGSSRSSRQKDDTISAMVEQM